MLGVQVQQNFGILFGHPVANGNVGDAAGACRLRARPQGCSGPAESDGDGKQRKCHVWFEVLLAGHARSGMKK